MHSDGKACFNLCQRRRKTTSSFPSIYFGMTKALCDFPGDQPMPQCCSLRHTLHSMFSLSSLAYDGLYSLESPYTTAKSREPDYFHVSAFIASFLPLANVDFINSAWAYWETSLFFSDLRWDFIPVYYKKKSYNKSINIHLPRSHLRVMRFWGKINLC